MKINVIENKFIDDNGNDLFNNTLQDFTSEICKKIAQNRELIIKERFKEITGYELDIVEEKKRRFKRLSVIVNRREETIYFNDGSIDGVRIVTFFKKDLPYNPDKFTIGYEEFHY